MYQLIYISTAVAGLNAEALDDIFAASRSNNRAANVTGMLLFNGRRFLQALEGEEAAVRKTYERIRADRRHRALVELGARVIGQREFGAWDMADASADGPSFMERVDRLTSGAEPSTRAHFLSYAAL